MASACLLCSVTVRGHATRGLLGVVEDIDLDMNTSHSVVRFGWPPSKRLSFWRPPLLL
ncbi:hypothetical protein J6590_038976 [Homalodisca vitripennis]|nr:hypothetical protein J6590_038976 [Homalodisca vitripennis]